jgi:hypothetical protein
VHRKTSSWLLDHANVVKGQVAQIRVSKFASTELVAEVRKRHDHGFAEFVIMLASRPVLDSGQGETGARELRRFRESMQRVRLTQRPPCRKTGVGVAVSCLHLLSAR